MRLHHHISKIPMEYTLPLRQKVLKPFLHKDDCGNPGDESPTTFHLGLFHERKLVTISTFLSEPHKDFNAGNPYRLRGMATDPTYQGQGFGQTLLQYGMTFLRQRYCDLIWCNARQRAFPFYEKMGFQSHGPLFELDRIGPHKVMYKYLIPR
ncbi:MAG: GNAT family N-acetyltransferase [Pseudobdellovibrionaceae bacterium]